MLYKRDFRKVNKLQGIYQNFIGTQNNRFGTQYDKDKKFNYKKDYKWQH